MKNYLQTHRKKIFIILSIFLAAVMLICGSIFLVKALVTDSDNGFTVTKNCTYGEDGKYGIKISSTKSNQNFTIAEEITDGFEVDFRVVPKEEKVSDFSSVTFSLVDVDSGFGIDLVWEIWTSKQFPTYEAQQDGSPALKVNTEWYRFGASLSYKDTIAGAYTRTLWDELRVRTDENTDNTSEEAFSKGNNTFTGAGHSIRFGYDLYEHEIYYYDNANNKTVFADLDTELGLAKMGRVQEFPQLSSYSLNMTFSGIKEPNSAPATLILYSLNGQSLAGETFTNEKGATICGTPKINNGVVGKKYTVSTEGLRTVDVLDGVKDGVTGTVSVTYPDKTVKVLDANDLSFTPETFGKHTLIFVGKDSQGLEGQAISHDFYVYESEPEMDLALEYTLRDATIGTGGTIILPKANLTSQLTKNGQQPTLALTVKRADGTVFETLDYATTNQVKFDQAGEYTVEYLATSYLGTVLTKTCKITVKDDIPVFKVSEFITNVQFNSIVTVPDATVNGEKAKFIVYYPSGSTTELKTLKLIENGDYIIRYTSGDYTYDMPFAAPLTPASLFENVSGVTVNNYVDAPEYSAEFATGVGLEASVNGASAKFLNAIDVSDNRKEDSLIKFMITPTAAKSYEFSTLTFTLTDALDPSISLDLRLTRPLPADAYKSELSIKSNYMESYSALNNVRGSFWGISPEESSMVSYPTTSISLNYDVASKTIYATMRSSSVYHADGTLIMNDIYTNGLKLNASEFDGFPSGSVYLSVRFDGIVGSSANILMLGVDGQALSSEIMDDFKAPAIFVDYPPVTSNTAGYTNGVPVGVVGKAYNYFNARVIDLKDGACDYYVQVWDDNGRRFDLEQQNCFVPNHSGNYVLKYCASDAAGNYSEKSVTITVVDESSYSTLAYAWNVDMPTSGLQGYPVTILSGSASGGSGPIAVDTKVYYGADEIELIDGSFNTNRHGEYKVRVTLKDYLGTIKTEDFVINVEQNLKPVLVEATVPTALLVGEEFIFAEWSAYDYTNLDASNNPALLPVTVRIEDGEILTDGKWTPTTEGTYTIQFVAGSGTNESIGERTVCVVKSDRDDRYFTNFFYVENAAFETSETDMPLVATSSDAKAYFIKPIDDKFLEFSFSGDTDKNNFDAVKINLVDSKNPSQKVTFEIKKTNDDADKKAIRSSISLNGTELNEKIAGSFYSKEKPFVLKYNYKTGAFTDYDGKTICYAESINGEKIVGFESGFVYLSFEFVNVTGDAAIRFNSLAGQVVTSSTTAGDYMISSIILERFKSFTYGEEIVISPAYAFDLTSNVEVFQLTVKSPSGALLLDKVDATKEHKFVANEYGDYIVSYLIMDGNSNRRTISNKVVCSYYEKPVLEYDGDAIPTKVKVETTITLPNITVSGTDKEVNLVVFVIRPTAQKDVVTDGTVTFDVVGQHQIVVVANTKYGTTVDTFYVSVVE